ncbi:MAG: flagellar hook-associated protein FlgK [Pirellulaceae bacterium]
MSLFSSLQQASNTLNAAQIGLQVVGNNIANVNTPDYLRQRVIYTPAQVQVQGNLRLGMGVQVEAIVQMTDKFLEERLRSSRSDLSNGETQEYTYLQLEALVGELSDTDISSSLNNFFGSINDILNQPEDLGVRNLSILRGETLAEDVSRLYQRVRSVYDDNNDRIRNAAKDINGLVNDIADLNEKIVRLEAGSTIKSDAVGLRDQRNRKLTELSEIVGIRTVEQDNGSTSVFVGGEYLVLEGIARNVFADEQTGEGLPTVDIKIEAFDSPLRTDSGKLAGLITSRDAILGEFLQDLDSFAQTLSFEFNQVFASGQGLSGYRSMEAEFDMDANLIHRPLDQVGLANTPENGSLQVKILNSQTGLTHTHDIAIRLNGTSDDTTLVSFSESLNAIDGISSSVGLDGRLMIEADSPNVEFAFAGDNSGVLASLGLGTFFTGTGALNMGIHSAVKGDPSKFAASQSGIGADTANAEKLAAFLDSPLPTRDGSSLGSIYQELVGGVAQAGTVARSVAEGFRVFKETLEGQKMGISGVNLDEESVRMITMQRQFQAASRMISTLDELLEILVNI